jgi:hypothetical protein
VLNATFNNISVISNIFLFETTCEISAYHHWPITVVAKSTWYNIVWQVGCVLQLPQTNQADRHDITEILLKVAFNTHNLNPFFFETPE